MHALSVDVEDFTSAALLLACGRIAAPTYEVVRNTEALLGLCAEHETRATWFVLGEVADVYPQLVRRIAGEGHELGVHGWHHHKIHQLDQQDYRLSMARAKSLLEDLSGNPVRGYRAVAMSISHSTWWAYEVLAELGFAYSSSVFPFRGSRYGLPGAPVGPYVVSTPHHGPVLEIPFSVVTIGPMRLPALGGGYLRHFPLIYTRYSLSALERRGRRAVVYLHPYELQDCGGLEGLTESLSPEEYDSLHRAVRGHFRNRHHTEAKIRWLLGRGRFGPLEEAFSLELQELEERAHERRLQP